MRGADPRTDGELLMAAAHDPEALCFTSRSSDAEDEDAFRRQEALQGHRERQGPRPPCVLSHILEKKSPKRKRRMSKPADISPHDEPRVKTLLGVKRRQGG